MTSKFKPIPIVSGLRKDHKPNCDPIKGPPVRQVCRAKNSPNAPLGNLICPTLRGASNEINNVTKSECVSTEEMKHHLLEANKKISNDKVKILPERTTKNISTNKPLFTRGKYVVGSMDVKALYPSIQWIPGSKEVKRGIRNSKLNFRNINKREAAQFIALNYSRNKILNEGVEKMIPVKLPGTNIKLASREGDQSQLFDYTGITDIPTGNLSVIMGMVVAKITHLCMSNHFYTFKGDIYKQTKGGSIGSELTGEVSKLYMVLWDQKFLKS